MKAKIKSILGYTTAILSLLVVVGMFPSIGFFAEPLIRTTGLVVSPNYTGGEVRATIDHDTYHAQVHRMVFDDTLIGERRKGFIQVDWMPLASLPPLIDDEIDADADGQPDFHLQVDTAKKETILTPYAAWVLEVQGTYELHDSMMVRVTLRNPSR